MNQVIKVVEKLLAEKQDLTNKELEELADMILESQPNFKFKSKRNEEYPVLSKSQLERREKKEIPFSSISATTKKDINIECD